jgi:hypothetical protein
MENRLKVVDIYCHSFIRKFEKELIIKNTQNLEEDSYNNNNNNDNLVKKVKTAEQSLMIKELLAKNTNGGIADSVLNNLEKAKKNISMEEDTSMIMTMNDLNTKKENKKIILKVEVKQNENNHILSPINKIKENNINDITMIKDINDIDQQMKKPIKIKKKKLKPQIVKELDVQILKEYSFDQSNSSSSNLNNLNCNNIQLEPYSPTNNKKSFCLNDEDYLGGNKLKNKNKESIHSNIQNMDTPNDTLTQEEAKGRDIDLIKKKSVWNSFTNIFKCA